MRSVPGALLSARAPVLFPKPQTHAQNDELLPLGAGVGDSIDDPRFGGTTEIDDAVIRSLAQDHRADHRESRIHIAALAAAYVRAEWRWTCWPARALSTTCTDPPADTKIPLLCRAWDAAYRWIQGRHGDGASSL